MPQRVGKLLSSSLTNYIVVHVELRKAADVSKRTGDHGCAAGANAAHAHIEHLKNWHMPQCAGKRRRA